MKILEKVVSSIFVLLISLPNSFSYASSSSGAAKEVDPDLVDFKTPKINFDFIDELGENRINEENLIRKILIPKSSREFSFAQKEALKINTKDIINSGTFKAVIRKGTQLVHLKTGKLFYNQKLLTVNAYKKSDYDGYKLLINKDGSSSYKVLANQIDNIEEITKLYELPEKYQEIEKKLDYRTNDNRINLTTQFNFNAGIVESRFFKNLARLDSSSAQSLRYAVQFYSQFKFPLKLGLSTSYENTFASFSNGQSFNMTSLSLGPIIKSKPYYWGKAEYSFFTEIRHTVFASASVRSPTFAGDFNLSQTSSVLGVERLVKTFLGNFTLGLNYQKQWLRPSSKSLSSNFDRKDATSNTYMLSLGYRKDIL